MPLCDNHFMDKEKYSLLYDYYGALLTERQREAFELYYEKDLSLAEVAENLCISRQAVQRAFKKASEELEGFQKKLGLIKEYDI